MLARLGIQAGIGQPQSLHRPALNDVRLHDLLDIGFADMSIPHGVRIDHYVRPVFALIQAPGLIRANPSFQSAFSQFLLE
jgi:hypothetical protein